MERYQINRESIATSLSIFRVERGKDKISLYHIHIYVETLILWSISLSLHSLLLLSEEGVTLRKETRVRVSTNRSSKQQDKGLGFVNLVMYPAARLLNSERSPLVFSKQSLLRHLLEYVLGQEHMTVLVGVVLVLLWILNLLWKVWHRWLSVSVFEFINIIEILKLLIIYNLHPEAINIVSLFSSNASIELSFPLLSV